MSYTNHRQPTTTPPVPAGSLLGGTLTTSIVFAGIFWGLGYSPQLAVLYGILSSIATSVCCLVSVFGLLVGTAFLAAKK